MCCEDIFRMIFLSDTHEKCISVFSRSCLDTHFLVFRKSLDIHFFEFEGDIFSLAKIRNKLSIPIRLISSETVIEVCDDDLIFRMMH